MREILFRAKINKTESEWVEGFYVHIPCGRFMCDEHLIQTIDADGRIGQLYNVYESTLGQFTGLFDKNGKQIFEGDILKDDWGKIYKVFYTTKSCSFMAECTVTPNEWETGNYRIGEAWCETVRVIGNIHDNPELLEVLCVE